MNLGHAICMHHWLVNWVLWLHPTHFSNSKCFIATSVPVLYCSVLFYQVVCIDVFLSATRIAQTVCFESPGDIGADLCSSSAQGKS